MVRAEGKRQWEQNIHSGINLLLKHGTCSSYKISETPCCLPEELTLSLLLHHEERLGGGGLSEGTLACLAHVNPSSVSLVPKGNSSHDRHTKKTDHKDIFRGIKQASLLKKHSFIEV